MGNLILDVVVENNLNASACPREQVVREIFGLGQFTTQRTLHRALEIHGSSKFQRHQQRQLRIQFLGPTHTA